MTLRSQGRAGFTLAEVVIVCALVITLAGFTAFTGGDFLSRLSDSNSDERIRLEVNDFARWMQRIIDRSIAEGRDVSFHTSSYALPVITARFRQPIENVDRRSETLMFRAEMTSSGARPDTFRYTSRTQTMSPAFTMGVYMTGDNGRAVKTKWKMIVSGKGRIRVTDGSATDDDR